jgi:urease accessory protein
MNSLNPAPGDRHTERTEASAAAPVWPASLELHIGAGKHGTRLLGNRHRGPLYVQKPFYPEGNRLPHVYILHPPGGMVSGDQLSIELNIDAHCRALFTTPGAGRLYRARADRQLQRQQVTIHIGESACAEWLPGENIVYPGACARATTQVRLAANSCFMGWEIHCIGLPASGRRFDAGRLMQRFEIFRDRQPLLIDALNIDMDAGDILAATAGLAGRTVSALFVSGPFDAAADSEALVESLRAACAAEPVLLGVTRVADCIAIRYLGDCAWQVKKLFMRCWALLRPALIGRDACPPRIWAT